MSYPPGTIIRNTTAARINHWITAACFVLLTLSGLSMFHPLLSFLALLFGSGQWARAIHPWIGCVLLVSYAGLIVQFWRDNFWNWDDIAWMGAIVRVLQNEEEGVPEVGRFNAGQKFVFWSMALLVPALFLTGLVIWEYYFGETTTIETQRAAALIHSYAAIAAILVWITHVYAAIWVREVKPSLAEMLATCLAAVAGVMESSAAIALLPQPSATGPLSPRARQVTA